MAEEKPPTSEDKVRQLIRWGSADARAVAEQLLEKVKDGEKRGLTVGVVTCFIHAAEDGRCYEVGISTLPVEVSFWAAKEIAKKVEELQARGK